MEYYNVFGNKKELEVNEGERVEIILRSDQYCINDEEPLYHSGILNEIVYGKDAKGGSEPVGIQVTFDKDTVYNDGEKEFISFDAIEEVFSKKYEIVGYAMLNEGLSLSVKGKSVGKVINFDYINGNLIPVSTQEDNGSVKNTISEEDTELIRDIMRYGTPQKFSHYVLTKSR
ncbi:hypothetical protein [Bacillus sp. OAE603]|uniref:hypothetical protein n=1 Tax=Gottfriedia sp. OAE603 TaxID=2663872 RepID=UPI00178AA655